MRRPRGAVAILAIAAVALIGLAALPTDAGAHSGGLSPKDGCHKHKAAGERHWHLDGSAERGGECVKRDGIAYRVQEIEAPAPEIATPWTACPHQWAELHAVVGGFWAPEISDAARDLVRCLSNAYRPRE